MTIEHVAAILYYVLMVPLTWLLLRFDESRLSEEQLERAWPPSARDVHVFVFSPICLVIHFVRTRPWYYGWLLGLAATALVLCVFELTAYAIASAFDLPIPS